MKKQSFLNLGLAGCVIIFFSGCWTPPNANVQPKGNPGLIQSGIILETVQDPALVESIDAGRRTITLKCPDGMTRTCTASPEVQNFGQIKAGDQVKAATRVELAVYRLVNGRLPDGTPAETLGINAKVLQVDPSYRLLTLQYANGRSETFKADLQTRLEQMASGDSVAVRPVEVTSVQIKKP